MTGPRKPADDDVPASLTRILERMAVDKRPEDFEVLFNYYAPRIKSYMLRLGADDVTAEDLAQEAMVSVWNKAHMFDSSKAAAGTWMFAIARNLRIDAIRRERRPELDPNDPSLVPEAEPMADDTVSLDQERAKVRDALKDLPEEQLIVVQKSFYEDKPHGEIAEELGLPLGTVKSRLRLAYRRIRSAVGEQE